MIDSLCLHLRTSLSKKTGLGIFDGCTWGIIQIDIALWYSTATAIKVVSVTLEFLLNTLFEVEKWVIDEFYSQKKNQRR